MADEIERYVDTEADPGGDGTTSGLSGGTCAYQTAQICETAEDGDFVNDDEQKTIHLHGQTTSDGRLIINGSTCDATRYWKWIGTDRVGVYSANDYRMESGDIAYVLGIFDEYTKIFNIQIKSTSVNANHQETISISGLTNCTIQIASCIIVQAGQSIFYELCLYLNDADVSLGFWNNVVYGCGDEGSTSNTALYIVNCGQTKIINCTISDGEFNIRRNAGQVILHNNAFNDADDGSNSVMGTTSGDYNTSDLASIGADYVSDGHDKVNQNYANTWENEAGDDYRLKSGDSVLHDEGVDKSGEGITDDILGVARAGWSIGAFEDEVPPAGGANPWWYWDRLRRAS